MAIQYYLPDQSLVSSIWSWHLPYHKQTIRYWCCTPKWDRGEQKWYICHFWHVLASWKKKINVNKFYPKLIEKELIGASSTILLVVSIFVIFVGMSLKNNLIYYQTKNCQAIKGITSGYFQIFIGRTSTRKKWNKHSKLLTFSS